MAKNSAFSLKNKFKLGVNIKLSYSTPKTEKY